MKAFKQFIIGFLAISAAALATAEETVVSVQDLKAQGIVVKSFVVDINAVPQTCPNERFDAFDTNQDGILDEGCYGLVYDACAGESPDYNAWFAAGKTCQDEPTPVKPTRPTNCTPAGQLTTGAPAC